MLDFNVAKTTLCNKFPSKTYCFFAPLYTHDATRGTDARGEQVQAASRAATDFKDTATLYQPNLIEQPSRLVAKLVGLLLQPHLLRGPVAKKVLIAFVHC
jgi:hypothetical protein